MKTKFSTYIKAITDEELNKFHLSKSSLIAKASSLIPQGFKDKTNPDIMPIVYSIAVVNKLNENGDGILPIDAAKMLTDFSHKPINIEHEKDIIVGHMVKASFSYEEPDFYENDIFSFLDEEEPFFISCAGFIYRSVYPAVAELLEKASDPSDPSYRNYSASWEIAFSDYDIVVTDESKKISTANIINKNSPDFSSLNSLLLCNGGKGLNSNGQRLGRILKGQKFPIGCAITESPAAKVKGIYSAIKISQSNVFTVKEDNTSHIMTEEQYNNLQKQIQAVASSDSPSAKILAEIKDTLTKEGVEWKSKAEKTQDALAKSEQEAATLKEELKTQKEELAKLAKQMADKNMADTLNDRMNSLASDYDFSDQESEIIAGEVRVLPLDQASFDKYKEKVAVIFAHKKKGTTQLPAQSVIDTVSQASTIPNNNAQASDSKSLFQKLIEKGLEIE